MCPLQCSCGYCSAAVVTTLQYWLLECSFGHCSAPVVAVEQFDYCSSGHSSDPLSNRDLYCCATSRKVAGSIPADVIRFLIYINSLRSHYGPGVESASNRNEYQEDFLGIKAAGA